MRRFNLSLLAILLCALILRLIGIADRPLWYDEAFAVLFSDTGLEGMLYGTLTPVAGGAADIHPLLYYLSLDVWMSLFGQSPTAVRLWSVILGVITVHVVYRLARDLFEDERPALASALIAAISPFLVQYGQEVRMYSLMSLLLTLATWLFVRGLRAGKFAPRYWIPFGIVAALAMYTQQLSAFYLGALALTPIVLRRRSALPGLAFGALIGIVIYLPWLVNIPSQLAKVGSYYWIPVPNATRPLLTLRSFFAANLDLPAPQSLIALFAALIVMVFLVVQILLRLRGKIALERFAVRFAVWMFASPILFMWLISQVRPVYLDRGLIGSAVMLCIALGWLFTKGGLPRPIAIVLGGIALIAAGIGLQAHYTWRTFPNSPFESVIRDVTANWQTGDVIVHQDKLTALPSLYYAEQGSSDVLLTQAYLRDTPGSSDDTLALPTQQTLGWLADDCLQTAVNNADRVWWVMFSFAPAQYDAAGSGELRDQLAWLDAHYTRAGENQFNDLVVILFNNPRDLPPQPECSA